MSSLFSSKTTSSVSTDTTAITKKATAQSQAVSDEEARRTALRGTSSTALAGTERTTLGNVSIGGDANVVTYKSDTSEQNAYAAERALQGVATDNQTIYTLAKRQGGNPSFLTASSTEIDDTGSATTEKDSQYNRTKAYASKLNEEKGASWNPGTRATTSGILSYYKNMQNASTKEKVLYGPSTYASNSVVAAIKGANKSAISTTKKVIKKIF